MVKSSYTMQDCIKLSKQGKICGILGCPKEPIERCPHCDLMYCEDHCFVIETPGHQCKEEDNQTTTH